MCVVNNLLGKVLQIWMSISVHKYIIYSTYCIVSTVCTHGPADPVSQLLIADPSRSMLTAVITIISNLINSRCQLQTGLDTECSIEPFCRVSLSTSHSPSMELKKKKKTLPGICFFFFSTLYTDPCPKSDSNGLPTQRYDSTVADAPLAQGNTEDATILMD